MDIGHSTSTNEDTVFFVFPYFVTLLLQTALERLVSGLDANFIMISNLKFVKNGHSTFVPFYVDN